MSENQADKIEPDCVPSDTKDKWEVVSEGGQKLLIQPHVVREAVARLIFMLRWWTLVNICKRFLWQTKSDLQGHIYK